MGGEAKSYESKKAWYSINHLVLSNLYYCAVRIWTGFPPDTSNFNATRERLLFLLYVLQKILLIERNTIRIRISSQRKNLPVFYCKNGICKISKPAAEIREFSLSSIFYQESWYLMWVSWIVKKTLQGMWLFIVTSDISAFKDVSLLQEANIRGGGKTNSRRR